MTQRQENKLTKKYGLVSIIIFSSDSGFDFIEASETQPSVFTEDGSVIWFSHGFHDVFLSGPFKSWGVVVLCVTESSFVMSGSSEEFFFSLSFVVFGCLFSEEIISVEDPISVGEGKCHPNGSDSSEPPLVCFENEVCIVKHLIYLSQVNIIISNPILTLIFFVINLQAIYIKI